MNIQRLIHKHYLSIFFLIILCALVASLLAGPSNAGAEQTIHGNTASGINTAELMSAMNMHFLFPPETVPDFTLMSLDGSKIQLSELRGKVVLLSFWTTW